MQNLEAPSIIVSAEEYYKLSIGGGPICEMGQTRGGGLRRRVLQLTEAWSHLCIAILGHSWDLTHIV